MATKYPSSPANMLKVLERTYPEPRSELDFQNEYQLVCAVMLSAQCTDKKVNQVTPSLFARFPDFAALSRATLDEVEAIIRPINYYRTKAKHLIAAGTLVTHEMKGELPRTLETLQKLPGVGRKTASVVLGELGVEETLPVDTHVFRVARRLGLSDATNREKLEHDLRAKFKPSTWRALHHSLILHGRRICIARKPQCAKCPLNKMCPSAERDID